MTTLTISEIFNNFSFYEQYYPAILNNSEQYHAIVEDSLLDVWPLSTKPLYLGELLQLWLSQKWRVNQACQVKQQDCLKNLLQPLVNRDDLYVYQIQGNLVLGRAVIKAWSILEQREIELITESSLQYYCTYKSVS